MKYSVRAKSSTFLLLLFFSIGLKAQVFSDESLKFSQALNWIGKYYVDSVSQPELVETAIIEMLQTLDPHSTYLTREEVKAMSEPLQGNFTRVFAENLSQLLGAERISIAPSRDRALADYRITMEVLRFDASRDGTVMLTAYWNIYTKEAINPVATRKSEHSLNASQNAGYAELVHVLSTSIAQLSREIADTIQEY